MKLLNWTLCLGLLSAVLHAEAADSVFKSVTRQSGGQILSQTLDSKAAKVTVDLSAQNYKILLRGVYYTNLKGTKRYVALNTLIASNPQAVLDGTGGIFIPAGGLPIRINLADPDLLTSIQVQAESFGGLANLKVSSYVTVSAGPIVVTPPPVPVPTPTPGPVPTPVPPPVDLEAQCRAALPTENSLLTSCNSNESNEQYNKSNLQSQRDSVYYNYQRAVAPLSQCQSRLQNATTSRAAYQQAARDAQSSLNSYQGQLNHTLNQLRDAQLSRQGRLFRCVVNGRHESFVGEDRSQIVALHQALKACGVNNCGKNAWNSNNWSCDIR